MLVYIHFGWRLLRRYFLSVALIETGINNKIGKSLSQLASVPSIYARRVVLNRSRSTRPDEPIKVILSFRTPVVQPVQCLNLL